jgi:hypothetical protein
LSLRLFLCVYQIWPCGDYCVYDGSIGECVPLEQGCSLEGWDSDDGNGICVSRLCESKIPEETGNYTCGEECVQGIDKMCKLFCEV